MPIASAPGVVEMPADRKSFDAATSSSSLTAADELDHAWKRQRSLSPCSVAGR